MQTMNEQIQKIIAEQLPAQVGEVLKARLKQADLDAAEVARLRNALAASEDNVAEHSKTIRRLNDELAQHAKLDDREATVAGRENKLDVTLAQSKAAAAEDKCSAIFGLVGTIFKNTVIREHVAESATRNTSTGYDNTSGGKTITREVE